MRTEISIVKCTEGAHVKAAQVQALAIDAVNGMSMKPGVEGTCGLFVTVKNTGTTQKNITVLAVASPVRGCTSSVVAVPAGGAVLLARFDSERFAGNGSLDFDFSSGFKGEIAAFRLPT